MQNLSRETKEFHNQLCAHTGALLCGGKNQAPGGERLRSLDMLCVVSLHTNTTLTFACFWTYNLLICPSFWFSGEAVGPWLDTRCGLFFSAINPASEGVPSPQELNNKPLKIGLDSTFRMHYITFSFWARPPTMFSFGQKPKIWWIHCFKLRGCAQISDLCLISADSASLRYFGVITASLSTKELSKHHRSSSSPQAACACLCQATCPAGRASKRHWQGQAACQTRKHVANRFASC